MISAATPRDAMLAAGLLGLAQALASATGSAYAAAPTVEVICEGYVRPVDGREFVPGKDPDGARRVAGTIALIRADGATIVADPGMVAERGVILGGLAQRGVGPEDVTHVFLSHHHPDHTVHVGLFPNATVVDSSGLLRGDLWSDHPDRYTIAPGVWVLRTPGHTRHDASLVVEAATGVEVLTHVWWDDRMQPAIDPLAEDQAALERSRVRVLEVADWIIPGHGKRFRNPSRPAGAASPGR